MTQTSRKRVLESDDNFEKKSRPDAATLKRLITETAALIRGVKEEIKTKDVIIKIALCWETDKDPTLDILEIKAIKKRYTFLERILLPVLEHMEPSDSDEVVQFVHTSKPFNDFAKRITKVCDETDELENIFKGFSFDPDILDPAEKLVEKRPRSF